MGKWLNRFIEKEPQNRSDKSDSYNSEPDLSLLSPPAWNTFGKNLRNISRSSSDKSDNYTPNPGLSLLSPSSRDTFGKTFGNMLGTSSDKSDSWDLNTTSSFYEDYEERLAIAEVDGNQDPIHAHCIAYLDAFIALLWNLAENDPHQGWLAQKVQTALAILEVQNFPRLN